MSEPNITTRNEFNQRCWTYFRILEDDFLQTERYLAIDALNATAYSNEYIKQYQAICSEIDVIAKSFCKATERSFKGGSINAYCKCIMDNYADFSSRIVKVKNRSLILTPWDGWTYSTKQKDGKTIIDATNPEWWQTYNKVKHSRTTVNTPSGLSYYKLANQKNVLTALAALFQLELYYFRKLQQIYFPTEADMPSSPSKLFEIESWGNTWVVLEGDLQLQLD